MISEVLEDHCLVYVAPGMHLQDPLLVTGTQLQLSQEIHGFNSAEQHGKDMMSHQAFNASVAYSRMLE